MHVNDTTPANGANDEMQHCHHLDIAVAAETDLIGEKHSSRRFHLQCVDSDSKRPDNGEVPGMTHEMHSSMHLH